MQVNADRTKSWVSISQVPSSTSSDENKVLTVNASGVPEWQTPGGGSVTFPLEVSGSTNVYEARDGLTSGYANAGEIYVGYHDDNGGGEPDIDTVSITPYMVQVKADTGGVTPTMTEVTPGVVTLYDNEGGNQYVDFYKVANWDNTYDAVNSSAAYWNSAYNAINSSASYWNDAAGMNEYPISAGPGMSIEDVSGVTVFSTDETVLFSGDINAANTTGTLSEPITNFKRIRVKYGLRFNASPRFYDEFPANKIEFYCSKQCYQDNNVLTCGGQFNISGTTITLVTWFQAVGTTVTANSGQYYLVIQEVVGIDRVSGGN